MNPIHRPTDPYSADWISYWSANPNLPRGVGADAAADAGGGEGTVADAGGKGAEGAAVNGAGADNGTVTDKGTGNDVKAELSPEDLKLAGDILNRDWSADMPDVDEHGNKIKETAKRFASKVDAVRSLIALQKREGQVRVPGKDAKPEEIAAYHKAIGIPDKPENYEFPDLPEGLELNDQVKESRAEWSKRLHALHVPKETAKELSRLLNEDTQRQMLAQIEADKAFATQQEAQLRKEWPGEEFDRNKTLANNAFREIAAKVGLNVEALQQIETKDGRFLMDRSEIVRVFAAIGREMAEGTLGPTLTDSEKDTLEDQVRDIRAQQTEAQNSGDSKRANKLYQQEQALLAKKEGNKAIVGSRGRMV